MVHVYSYNEMEANIQIDQECGVRPGGSVSLIKGEHNLGPIVD